MAVHFGTRHFEKAQVPALQYRIVAPEIIGMQNQSDAAPTLPAHDLLFFVGFGLGQQRATTGRAKRCYYYPALALAHILIRNQARAQYFRIESNGFVVTTNEQGDVGQVLVHRLMR